MEQWIHVAHSFGAIENSEDLENVYSAGSYKRVSY